MAEHAQEYCDWSIELERQLNMIDSRTGDQVQRIVSPLRYKT
jgi:hypothetical protein